MTVNIPNTDEMAIYWPMEIEMDRLRQNVRLCHYSVGGILFQITPIVTGELKLESNKGFCCRNFLYLFHIFLPK